MDGLVVVVDYQVCGRIEVQSPRYGQCHGEFGTSDEGICVGIAVGTTAEVTVERGDNGVFAVVVIGVSAPLTDARTARIGHDDAANGPQVVKKTVAFGGETYLF